MGADPGPVRLHPSLAPAARRPRTRERPPRSAGDPRRPDAAGHRFLRSGSAVAAGAGAGGAGRRRDGGSLGAGPARDRAAPRSPTRAAAYEPAAAAGWPGHDACGSGAGGRESRYL